MELRNMCERGDMEAVALLLGQRRLPGGAAAAAASSAAMDVNEPSISGQTALMLASGRGHLDVVNALLATGAHVNLVSRAPAGVSALMAAAQHGHSKVCESLMNGANNAYTKVCASARADVNLTNDFGANALSMAARGGHLECVALLLRRGARRGTLDMHGMTALHIAAKGNHARICIELMRHEGADAAADSRTVDPIAADKRGRSALELAAEAGAFAAVRAMLEAPQCRPAHVLRAHALAVAAGKHAVAAQLMAFHTRPQVRFRSEDGASTRALGLAEACRMVLSGEIKGEDPICWSNVGGDARPATAARGAAAAEAAGARGGAFDVDPSPFWAPLSQRPGLLQLLRDAMGEED